MKHLLRSLPLALLFIGAGCTPVIAPSAPGVVQPATHVSPIVATDPYAGWGTIEPGNVVSLRIPPGCVGDPGAGNIYVTCGTDQGKEDKTVIHTSSDGLQANIRHGAIKDWDQWDKVVASIHVLAPLGRAVQITIEK